MYKAMVKFVRSSAVIIFVSGRLLSQEKSSARDMYFGGLEAAAAASTKKPAPKQTTIQPKRSPAVQSSAPHPGTGHQTVPRATVPLMNAVNMPLGLRCSILKGRAPDAVEVPASTRFHSGDQIELRVQANQDGYLYIITQGSSGTWQGIFPKPGTQGPNRIKANEEHISSFHFDAKPGVEKLFIVVSRTPERDLDSLIYNLKRGSDAPPQEPATQEHQMLASNFTVGDRMVEKMRNSYNRDLVLEEVAAPDETERAMYVVAKTGGMAARVVADIKLIHQ